MNRRNLLKMLGTSAANITKPQNVLDVIEQPVKKTINATRAYDRAVKKINLQGNNVSSRRSFLGKVKKQGLIEAGRSPKESVGILQRNKNRLTSLLGKATLNWEEAALRPYANKTNAITNLTNKITGFFNEEDIDDIVYFISSCK